MPPKRAFVDRGRTLRPGARETPIALFDGELVEPQEAAGLEVLGQFRDLDDPDRFVQLTGSGSRWRPPIRDQARAVS